MTDCYVGQFQNSMRVKEKKKLLISRPLKVLQIPKVFKSLFVCHIKWTGCNADYISKTECAYVPEVNSQRIQPSCVLTFNIT